MAPPAPRRCPFCGQAHAPGVRACPGDPCEPALVSRRALVALAAGSLILAAAAAVLVHGVFTGVFLEVDPSPPPAAVASPPPAEPKSESAPAGRPGGPAMADAPAPPEPPEPRRIRRDAELDVPERLEERAQEVRQARRRYRELEREVAALGGPANPAAQDTLAEMEQLARELRQAEAELDRARRRPRYRIR